ncbi:MAG: type II toxin-antitoxin system RelE/ParE family toxin [Verrucomicrobiota bacterium]
MKYRVILPRSVEKKLDKLSAANAERILNRLEQLAENPRPSDCKKLAGRVGYRVRVGNYRVIYDIYDQNSQVVIITIGHRREVYR